MFQTFFVVAILVFPIWVIWDSKKSFQQRTEKFQRQRPGADNPDPSANDGDGKAICSVAVPLIRTTGRSRRLNVTTEGASGWGLFPHPNDPVSHNIDGVHDVHVGGCPHGDGGGAHGSGHC